MTRETRRHPARDRLGRSVKDPAYREVHDALGLRRLVTSGGSLSGWRLQGLDLEGLADCLVGADVRGMVVLGGSVPADLAQDLLARGAVIVPTDSRCPIEPFRARLYTPFDLYGGMAETGYASTVDARAYAWSREKRTQHDAYATLLRAAHDDAVHDALVEALHGLDPVGVAVARRPAHAYGLSHRAGRTRR